MSTIEPPPSRSPWDEKQLHDALSTIRFYARRAIALGASEDDVYDQVVNAIQHQEAAGE
jgi:hypothetical protein